MHPKEIAFRLGDTDYVFSALTFKDWEEFATACQFYRYHRAKAVHGVTQSQLDKIFATCAEHEPTKAEVDAFSSSAAGMREIFWLSIKRKNPKLTRDQASDLFCLSDDIVATIGEWVLKVSLPEPPKKKEGEEGNAEAAVAN